MCCSQMVVGGADLPFFSESLRTEARALLVARYHEFGGKSKREVIEAVVASRSAGDGALSPTSLKTMAAGLARVLPGQEDDIALVGQLQGSNVQSSEHDAVKTSHVGLDSTAAAVGHPIAAWDGQLRNAAASTDNNEAHARPAAGQHAKGELDLRQRQGSVRVNATNALSAMLARPAEGALPPSAIRPPIMPAFQATTLETQNSTDYCWAYGIDRQYVLPLNVVLDRGVRAHLRAQLALAEQACFDLCVSRLGMVCHFQVLAQLMLFGSGVYASAFLEGLVSVAARHEFLPLGVKRAHERALSVAGLTELKTVEAFGYDIIACDHDSVVRLREILSATLGGSVKRAIIPFGSGLLRVVFGVADALRPVYSLQEHPVFENFFSGRILSVYAAVHRALLNTQLTQHVLKQVWLRALRRNTPLGSSAHRVQATSEVAPAPPNEALLLKSRDLCVFGHELMVFVQLITEYFKADVVHASWVQFMVRSCSLGGVRAILGAVHGACVQSWVQEHPKARASHPKARASHPKARARRCDSAIQQFSMLRPAVFAFRWGSTPLPSYQMSPRPMDTSSAGWSRASFWVVTPHRTRCRPTRASPSPSPARSS